ncbi:hypothetical protein BCR35DRAFT_301956, partial [Leucosporidium creatinivorum]
MIPSRRKTSAVDVPRQAESIPARLARLRSEQRGARRRFDSTASVVASTSRPRLPPLAATVEVNRPTRRTAPGPPPPPSWTAAAVTDGENRRGTWLREAKASGRGPSPTKERMLASLEATSDSSRPSPIPPGPPSLAQCVGEVVACDLSLPPAESLLLEHVHLLPPHLRLRMFDVAARSWPLEERAVVELLREDEDGWAEESEGDEAETEGDNDTRGDGEGLEGDWEEEDEEGGASASWDVRLGDGRGILSPFATLTSLNLAYSPLKLPFLRSLLINHSNPSKPIPSFPHLSTLNLAATHSLHFSEAFFALLSLLISLRHLSLAGKTLDHPSSVTQSTFLPRLAAATPTLLSVDLSYTTWPPILIRGVDWDSRWLDLKVVGMRRDLVNWKGEEIGEAKKEKIRKDVWAMISTGRKKPRRWVEVIV